MRSLHLTLIPALGSALGLAGVLLIPAWSGGTAEQLEAIAATSARSLAWMALSWVAALLIGVGFALLSVRCFRTGHRVAGWFSVVAAGGWLVHPSIVALNGVAYPLALIDDRAGAVAALDALYASPVFLGILVPMLLTSVVGTVGTAVALWRARLAPVWAAAALGLSTLADFVTPEVISGIPMFVLLMIGFVGLSLTGRPSVSTTTAPVAVG